MNPKAVLLANLETEAWVRYQGFSEWDINNEVEVQNRIGAYWNLRYSEWNAPEDDCEHGWTNDLGE